MGAVVSFFILITACVAVTTAAQAQSGSLEVTATYRERIAVPPDAQLYVQLLDVTRADAMAIPIASQRFAMSGVPVTVTLTYDPTIIAGGQSYTVAASLWSGDQQLFRTPRRYLVLDGVSDAAVDVVMSMVEQADDASVPTQMLSGIRWAVTEIEGVAWINDDPATLLVDDALAFSIYGGCNRFTGQIGVSGDQITFPENYAGTLMACPDDAEGQERRFLAALARVARYVRYGAGLVMMDANGVAVLHFEDKPE